jgi:hypothetical protein
MNELLISFLLILTSFNIVQSPDCLDSTIKENWHNADLIFEINVIQRVNNSNLYGLGAKLQYSNVIVTKVLEGEAICIGDTLSIVDYLTSDDFQFKPNNSYLVFTRANKLLIVLKCLGTIPIEHPDYQKVVDSILFYKAHSNYDEIELEKIPVFGKVKVVRKSILTNHLLVVCGLFNVILFVLLIFCIRRKQLSKAMYNKQG